jgi:hypothetical protein
VVGGAILKPESLQATGTASFNLGTMHSDFGTGLIYSDDGNVADPSTLRRCGLVWRLNMELLRFY